jgi:hypothetical protein
MWFGDDEYFVNTMEVYSAWPEQAGYTGTFECAAKFCIARER